MNYLRLVRPNERVELEVESPDSNIKRRVWVDPKFAYEYYSGFEKPYWAEKD